VGQLRTEYYRHGVLKVRVSYQGTDRLAAAIRAGVPGYRVRVIGEADLRKGMRTFVEAARSAQIASPA
jgi:hypothetical protein